MIPKHAKTAFSLTEIVLVTVIISIIATIAAPRMESYNKNQAINALSQKIVLDLALARSEAIKRRTSVTVHFDIPGQYYEFVGITDIARPNGSVGNYRIDLGEENGIQARLDIVEFGDSKTTDITFDAFGRADNDGGVLVTAGDISRVVVIDQTTGCTTRKDSKIRSDVNASDPFDVDADVE